MGAGKPLARKLRKPVGQAEPGELKEVDMRFRFNDGQDIESETPPPGDSPEVTDWRQLRSDGEDLLAAGDIAIRRALSGNSLRFLSSIRQKGGQ